MSKIVAIKPGRARQRVRVVLDEKTALTLEGEVVAREGLAIGQELSAADVGALTDADQRHRCYRTAARFLGYRQRSETELRQRLKRGRFHDNVIEVTVTRLKEQGLIDDLAFARFWRNNRETFSPRSQWLTKRELKQKGVSADIIEQVVVTVDDRENAYRAARTWARRLSATDRQTFVRRLSDHLKRRGFGYDAINHTLKRLAEDEE